ncbi:hypothetical protein FDP41_002681 [Naegleria fowleri]|uniref:YbaK/aminoacyl-tRNA synthetase-associated domain-containing protein n=1 Tax=Naegleria fowleri TaxID=5763 RepID=A0A6A5BSL1_NAEFO|nr:uncharacterized protein FDP41_002681 [Naegleria fowleri]KAF0978166.1 hypothetical protein FDP41_002681 [Naegleria fowleri]
MEQSSFSLQEKEQILLNFLRNELQMKAETEYHGPSDTVDDWKRALNGRYSDTEQVNYKLCKNFFLHHKKKKQQKFYGVALADTMVDMNSMSKQLGLGSGNLRFADPEDLTSFLDIQPGHVTPLCFHVLHPSVQKQRPDILRKGSDDSPSVVENMKTLTIIIDAALLRKNSNASSTMLLFHPLHNSASTAMSQEEFVKFMKSCFGEEAWKQFIVYDFENKTKLSVHDVDFN